MKTGWKVLLAVVMSHSLTADAAEKSDQPIQREITPGSELMTSGERERYRQRMRAAGTPHRQAEVREQHVRQMRQRARLRGLGLAPLPKQGPQ